MNLKMISVSDWASKEYSQANRLLSNGIDHNWYLRILLLNGPSQDIHFMHTRNGLENQMNTPNSQTRKFWWLLWWRLLKLLETMAAQSSMGKHMAALNMLSYLSSQSLTRTSITHKLQVYRSCGIIKFSPLEHRDIKISLLTVYRLSGTHGWFGEKAHLDVDICVKLNILVFLFSYLKILCGTIWMAHGFCSENRKYMLVFGGR